MRVLGQLRIAVAAALLLAAGNVAALGLGQIQVKSQRNQPLLAEIPIISTTPGELEALQARLASPETFRRVGLAPPTGVAADLQFSLGSDARGRPVIRVTTLKPVDQSVLNFLIEVDWGQGRLVREYTALVDAPRTTSAGVQPAIEAPRVDAPNVVQRPLAPTPPPAEPPSPATPVAAEPVRAPANAIPLPAAPLASAAPAATPGEYGPVKRGEALSSIVGKLDLPGGTSLDQAMLALLRANPDAFLGGDINRLKRGAVLRVPGSGELQAVAPDEAAMVVREQMRQWRQARRPVAQPSQVDAAPQAATQAASPKPPVPMASAPTPAPTRQAAPQPSVPKAASPKAVAQSPGRSEARLQIVPPTGPGKATATRTGASAGGEGSMLQQQLRQKDEDIAAKAAEIGELKERVAELEKLRQDQQAMIALKDSELAAAQQRLAEANAKPAATVATPQPAAVAAKPAAEVRQPVPEDGSASSTTPWLWGGLAVLGMAVLAWLVMRRGARPASRPPVRQRTFDADALAASLRAPSLAASDPEPADTADVAVTEEAGAPGVAQDEAAPAAAAPPPARNETPTWHSGWVRTEPPSPPQPVAPPPRFVAPEPVVPAEPEVSERGPQASAIAQAKASVEHRMKLARAFLDIGDDHSAKQLLREIMDDVDPAARDEAARMLRELG